VWAPSATGEADAEVLLAVRHHPTGHPRWKDVGRALYVADFCEPTRAFAAEHGTARMLERAAAGGEELGAVALEVLVLRLRRAIEERLKGKAVEVMQRIDALATPPPKSAKKQGYKGSEVRVTR